MPSIYVICEFKKPLHYQGGKQSYNCDYNRIFFYSCGTKLLKGQELYKILAKLCASGVGYVPYKSSTWNRLQKHRPSLTWNSRVYSLKCPWLGENRKILQWAEPRELLEKRRAAACTTMEEPLASRGRGVCPCVRVPVCSAVCLSGCPGVRAHIHPSEYTAIAPMCTGRCLSKWKPIINCASGVMCFEVTSAV